MGISSYLEEVRHPRSLHMMGTGVKCNSGELKTDNYVTPLIYEENIKCNHYAADATVFKLPGTISRKSHFTHSYHRPQTQIS